MCFKYTIFSLQTYRACFAFSIVVDVLLKLLKIFLIKYLNRQKKKNAPKLKYKDVYISICLNADRLYQCVFLVAFFFFF